MSSKKNTRSLRIVEVSIRKDRTADDNPFENLTAERFATFRGIKETRVTLGVAHELYVRQLLHAGRIEGVKVELKGYNKWFIDPASVTYYNANKATRSGMRRYLLRANKDAEDAIREALDAAGINYTLELNYKGKEND